MTYDIEVDGPHKNFVANGLVVHNSARYTPLPDVNYVPTLERLMLGIDGKNKQAGTTKDAEVLTPAKAEAFQLALGQIYEAAEELYQEALKAGVPKELARVHLPRQTAGCAAPSNLRGGHAFALRSDKNPGAQFEIRQYANALHDILKAKFPRTIALFDGET